MIYQIRNGAYVTRNGVYIDDVIDDFEGSPLSNYTTGVDSGIGDGNGQVVEIVEKNNATAGPHVLQVRTESTSGSGWAYSNSLPNIPSAGASFATDAYFDHQESVTEVSWFLQNTSDRYPPGWKARILNDALNIRYTYTDGVSTTVGTASLPELRTDVFTVEIDTGSTTQTVRIYDSTGTQVGSASGDVPSGGTNYSSGAVGFRGGIDSGTHTGVTWFDNAHRLD